jgi:hypothetical protein
VRLAAAAALAAILVGIGDGAAQTIDGTYTGTIACGLLTQLRYPLRTDFSLTVARGEASYERPIVRPGRDGRAEPTGSWERGGGPVSPLGEVTLRGRCEGGFSCEAQYQGQLDAGAIRLTGSQRWQGRGKVEERTCEITLTRQPG